MSRNSFTASALVSLLRKIAGSVATFLGPSWDGARRTYQPHRYYMRGPGPKWREKHSRIGVSAGGALGARRDS